MLLVTSHAHIYRGSVVETKITQPSASGTCTLNKLTWLEGLILLIIARLSGFARSLTVKQYMYNVVPRHVPHLQIDPP